jgi:hypothetical protein
MLVMLFVALRGRSKQAAITEGKLDEIGFLLKHSPPKSFQRLLQENALSGFISVICHRSFSA